MERKTAVSLSPEKIDEIKNAVDIVDIISGYVPLKPAGKNLQGLCPFHQEKTPSFVVSSTGQYYHCFGCGAGGDVVKFLMGVEKYHFMDAISILADRAGITLNLKASKAPQRSQNQELFACIEEASKFYRNTLLQSSPEDEVQKYLVQREVKDESSELFRLGFVPDGWKNLYQYLSQNDFQTELQEKCGLIRTGEKGGYYDRLRNRLIFPIRNYQGKVIGFGGRLLGEGKPKYLNSPETVLYKKSSVFYGLYEAKERIRRKSRVIVVEGYLDVIRLHEEGWSEAIATCGTSLTSEHILALERLRVDKAYLLFDGDKAGIRAAEKSAKLFLEHQVDSFVVILPDGLDPDDYFKKYDSASFQQLLDDAKPDYEFIINQAYRECAGEGMSFQEEILRDLLTLAGKLNNVLKRELFLTSISKIFSLAKDELKKGLQSKKNPTFQQQSKPSFADANSLGGITFDKSVLREVELFQCLMAHTQAIHFLRKNLLPDDFTDQRLANLYRRFLHLDDEEFTTLQGIQFSEIFAEDSNLISYLLQSGSSHKIHEFSEDSLKKLIYSIKKQRLKSIQQQMNFDPSSDKTLELIKQKKKLLGEIEHLNPIRDPNMAHYLKTKGK